MSATDSLRRSSEAQSTSGRGRGTGCLERQPGSAVGTCCVGLEGWRDQMMDSCKAGGCAMVTGLLDCHLQLLAS